MCRFYVPNSLFTSYLIELVSSKFCHSIMLNPQQMVNNFSFVQRERENHFRMRWVSILFSILSFQQRKTLQTQTKTIAKLEYICMNGTLVKRHQIKKRWAEILIRKHYFKSIFLVYIAPLSIHWCWCYCHLATHNTIETIRFGGALWDDGYSQKHKW